MEHKAVKKAKKGLFSIVFGRTALILMLVLIQLIILVGVATILKGYYDMFRPQGTTIFVIWMLIALGCLGFIAYISSSRKKQKKS